jgi:hypothetical protein
VTSRPTWIDPIMRVMGRKSSTLCAAVAVLILGPAPFAFADSTPIQVNPNRPTFSTPALTTQEGVAELEFGLAHSELDTADLDSSPFLLKLGVLKRVELRIGGNGLLHATALHAPSRTGYGDTTLGAQWTFLPDGPLGIDEAIQATWKLPTASSSNGLGSGGTDFLLMLLLSRDLGAFHFDFNLLANWLGRRAPRFDGAQPALSLSVSRPLRGPWTLTGEIYSIGGTSGGRAIVSNLWSIGYKVSSRFVLDSGVDVGLSEAAPRATVFAGLTCGLARFRHPRQP